MKKGLKRGIAALLVLLMLGCDILPSIGTRAADSDSGTGTNTNTQTEEAYVKYDFENTALSTYADLKSIRIDKSTFTKLSEGKIQDHWFAGTTGYPSGLMSGRATTGLKPTTHASYWHRLDLTETSDNFELVTQMDLGSYFGIAFGESDVYPKDGTGVAGLMFYQARIQAAGAVDVTTLKGSGTDYASVNVGGTGWAKIKDWNISGSSTVTPANMDVTFHVKLENGVITFWLDEFDATFTVELSSAYKSGTISIMSRNCNEGGGFKNVTIKKYDTYMDFEHESLTKYADLKSIRIDKSTFTKVSEGKIQDHWFAGTTGYPSGLMSGRATTGLKPTTHASYWHRLDLTETSDNFELVTQMDLGSYFGIAFGESDVYPKDGTGVAGLMFYQARIQAAGAIDATTLKGSGTDYASVNVGGTGWAKIKDWNISGSSTVTPANKDVTFHVKLENGVISFWFDEFDATFTVELSSAYKSGTISIMSRNCNEGGGYKNVWIKNGATATPEPEPEILATPAEVGDSFSTDFTSLSALTDLDTDFNSYYFENTAATAVKAKPSQQWTTGKTIYTSSTPGVLRNDWLKPIHTQGSGTKHTLLTYKSKIFTNVEVEAEYVTNHLRYGVMIAPEGQLSTAQNGVRVYVDGSGLIKIQGAIDAGTATATGGYVYIGGQNSLSGFAVPNYVKASSTANNESNCTSYTIHIRISGNVMQVWLNECSEYIISVELTEAYTGGMVSLYSTGYDHGAFKSFSAKENEGSDATEDSSIYTQSFNTISSLDELKDNFDAYTLGSSKTETPVAANIEDVYQLSKGTLKSNLTKAGTDYADFGILTLKNKRYENFELTLKFIQDPNRYAVMIGTEPGEFAFSGDSTLVNGNGGVLVYTEMQGYRNIRGSLYASSYTNAKLALHRKTEEPKLESFVAFKSTSADKSDVLTTLEKKSLHTMTIRVVDGYLTMLVDNNEASRVTVRLADYDGGYISLVTNVNKNVASSYGGFASLAIRELDENAELNTTLPETTDGFETMKQVEELFDAYYLKNVKESNKLEKVNLKEKWWLNTGGFLTRVKGGSAITVNDNMDILTYKKQKFTDFELTYSYQQTYQRMGIILGSDLGEYPLFYNDKGKLAVEKGSIIYIEAEGYPNAKGHLHNYTLKSDLLYRSTKLTPDGFTNAAGSASDNVNAKKVHTVKIVVKSQKLYVFLDGSEEASLYVKLGDDYKGGYVSLFSAANSAYGIGNFTITDKVTTKLPKAGGVEVIGNTLTAKFDTAEFDDSLFTTYHLAAVKNNENGTMKKTDFDDQWTVANGTIKRTTEISNGADDTRVSALTYNKPLTNFVVTYDYQQDSNRLMFMFGAEKGKYALSHNGKGSQQINGGVILYPEFDMGSGGGMVALGDVYPINASYRPIFREKITGLDYYVKENGGANAHLGKWHTMTIAVINQHCYIYIDDYGLVEDFSLGENYKGGYVSIAASGNTYGFRNLEIKDLSMVTEHTVISAENPRDLTALVGTDASALELPSTVKATLKNGKTVDASVDWIDFNYDAAVAGTYKFTGVVKEAAGIDNPASVGVTINIRVVEQLPTVNKNVKEWTFDTQDDLKDFETKFLKDKENGYITSNVPLWFVNENTGRLHRDEFRATNGTESKNLAIMTYTGEKYKNFELEVDYSWHSTRMMVMFGSEKIGAYIDLNDMKSEKNPAAVFVEMEGVRNVIGNVKNTDYYKRTDTTISTARENGDRIPNYYNKENIQSNVGTMHHMKVRVVGDQVSIWVDDYEEPFVTTLTNYDGGYISLVSTTKGGKFDNLKITRLSNSLGNEVNNVKAVANGYMNLTLDTNATTELVLPEREAPDVYDEVVTDIEKQEIKTIPFLLAGAGIIGVSTLIGLIFILLAWKKKKKGEQA